MSLQLSCPNTCAPASSEQGGLDYAVATCVDGYPYFCYGDSKSGTFDCSLVGDASAADATCKSEEHDGQMTSGQVYCSNGRPVERRYSDGYCSTSALLSTTTRYFASNLGDNCYCPGGV